MAGTIDSMWYLQPWQSAVVLVAAFNAGASSLQGLLTMPLLMLKDVPAHFEGKQLGYLLHASEFIFPPLNAFCTLSYMGLSTIAYRCRRSLLSSPTPISVVTAARLPRFGLALALHIATTVFTLTIMGPVNHQLRDLGRQLADVAAKKGEKGEQGNDDTQMKQEFRATQKKWQKLSYVRGVIMTGSAVVGMSALLGQVL